MRHFPALEEMAAVLSFPEVHSFCVTVSPNLTEVVWGAASQILLSGIGASCVF